MKAIKVEFNNLYFQCRLLTTLFYELILQSINLNCKDAVKCKQIQVVNLHHTKGTLGKNVRDSLLPLKLSLMIMRLK